MNCIVTGELLMCQIRLWGNSKQLLNLLEFVTTPEHTYDIKLSKKEMARFIFKLCTLSKVRMLLKHLLLFSVTILANQIF